MTYDIGYEKKSDSVSLFAWHECNNFGDKVGPALFHDIVKRPVYVEARGLSLIFHEGRPRTIYCFLGTLAHHLYGPHHFVFWGFGIAPQEGPAHHGCKPMQEGLDIEFRALRGPLTHQELLKKNYLVPSNIPYGDPALLIPYFYHRSPEQSSEYCLVPHHTQYSEWRKRFPKEKVIDIGINSYDKIQDLITELTSYKVIFSASLHVTILAESFGIPVKPVEPPLSFKFDDFYQSVNKKIDYLMHIPPDTDFQNLAIETTSHWRPIQWDPEPWLTASPFPLNQNMISRLRKHYLTLANLSRPFEG